MTTIAVKLKLSISPEDEAVFDATLKAYTGSYNRVAKEGFGQARVNGVELHHATYQAEKELSHLPAALICSARVRATESLKSARKLKAKKAPTANKPVPIRYNRTCSTIHLQQGYGTFCTVEGRKRVDFALNAYAESRLAKAAKICGSSEISRDKHGKYYLVVFVEIAEPSVEPTNKHVGVDLGIKRPAVTSLNQFLGPRQWAAKRRKYFRLRRALQAKGTRSAKRRLKRLSGIENRFRRDCDHVLSKKLVGSVNAGDTLVLEDLSGIRQKRHGKKFNRALHGWSFYRLRTYTEYKADEHRRYAVGYKVPYDYIRSARAQRLRCQYEIARL